MKRLLVAVVFTSLVFSAQAAKTESKAKTVKKPADHLGFAGSESCKSCHKVEYKSWKNEDYHSKMVRPVKEGIIDGVEEKWATDGTTQGPTTGNATGKNYTFKDVQYVVGSYWKQRYLVKNEDTGGLQFMNMQYNRMSGKWEKYGQKNDWGTMCATCHTTGYRIDSYNPEDPKSQKFAYTEMNIGCESCHGPSAKHVKTKKKADTWNFADKDFVAQSKVCGYCHIRVENEMFKSAQGNFREDIPHPVVGQSYKPSDDWTTWYPEKLIAPGIQAEDKLDKEYTGDLKGMFILDEQAKRTGKFEAGKHHEQYQEYIQGAHYKEEDISCTDCHNTHATKKEKRKVAKDTCIECHKNGEYTVEKHMPGTGKTADGLFVRSHTFVKDQQRKSGLTVSGHPVYKKKKK